MKKIVLLAILAAFATTPVMAEVNMPGEPSFSTPVTTTSSPSSNYKKTTTNTNSNYQSNYPKVKLSQPTTENTTSAGSSKGALDSMAMSALKAAERHDKEGMNAIIQKMMKAGAEGFSKPQIISKQTPHCPPIKIEVNGKKMSGSTCGMFGYLYKGKQYDVGYCK